MHRCRRIGRVVVVSRRDAAKPGPGHTASPTFFLNSEPLLSPSVCVCAFVVVIVVATTIVAVFGGPFVPWH